MNSATVSITKRPRYSGRGLRLAITEAWAIQGTLRADTPAALTTAINALKTAYSVDGKDLGLYLNDGTTLSSHAMISNQSTNGTRVVQQPSFPQGSGAEYATIRSYTIQVEAEFPDAESDLLTWNETLSFVGTGGPRIVHLETLTGLPQAQIVNQRTIIRATQSGQATGYLFYPFTPAPIWPGAELQDRRQLQIIAPTFNGRLYTNPGVSWSYQFESALPLIGRPNFR